MALDAHRHFWRYNGAEFGWIGDRRLMRDFLPEDCAGLDPCVAVEARQCAEETNWLLDLADSHDFIKGVVGWLPIAADDLEKTLENFLAAKDAKNAKLVGLRHVVQDEPDDDFILRPDFVRGVKTLLAKDLAYDILVFERHLANTVKFVDSLPCDARLVLDHLGKPHSIESWRTLIRELAKRENVHCKLSGLVTEVGKVDFTPYLETAIEAFGPTRLMFGSDWPVVTADMEYGDWKGVVESFASRLSESEHEAVMGGNARRFYGL